MRPELIIFDCDGVLIDSEAIASRLVARNLTALGWPMTAEDAMAIFLGMSIVDMEPMIEARLGRRVPADWRSGIAEELVVALGSEVTLIKGARQMLERVNALGIDWRVASNSSDAEMAVKFAHTGLAALTAGRTHSAGSLVAKGGRPKPAPDVFLAAAAAAGVAPRRCWVLEDSPLGVTGAVAAGMTCHGFAPHGDGAGLVAAGAVRILRSLDEFLGLLERVEA
jgi:beta-phosphoglucomutase-like phosphatase (HAD superfamily)